MKELANYSSEVTMETETSEAHVKFEPTVLNFSLTTCISLIIETQKTMKMGMMPFDFLVI